MMVNYAAQTPSPFSKILLGHLQGAISRVGQDETAYIHRAAPFLLNINAIWTVSHESDKHIGWARVSTREQGSTNFSLVAARFLG
jgi:hypothetical protein